MAIRTLIVPSDRYWVTGTIAEKITQHNPEVKSIICSLNQVNGLLERIPNLMAELDLVHFLVPVAAKRHIKKFQNKLPCVTTIHHIEPRYADDAMSYNFQGDAIMVVSEIWRKELISEGVDPAKIIKVPNGVETNVFKPPTANERTSIRRQLGFSPDDLVVGFFGKVTSDSSQRKGIDVFISALELLARFSPRTSVLIVGPGWGDMVDRLRNGGVKVCWRNFITRHIDVASMYKALDFYWVTSRIEGTPVPLLEAMSSGVCCLSTKVGAAPELIKDKKNGYLIEIGDSDRFVELTKELIYLPKKREEIGKNARKTVCLEFDWSLTTRRIEKLYRTAMENFTYRMHHQPPTNISDSAIVRLGSCRGEVARSSFDSLLSRRISRWLEAQDKLLLMAQLCHMDEKTVALREGLWTCLSNPLYIETWRTLSLFLPRNFQEGLKRFKRKLQYNV